MDRNMIEMKELTRDSRNLNEETSGIFYSSLTRWVTCQGIKLIF